MGKTWQWNDLRYCSNSVHFESCHFSEASLFWTGISFSGFTYVVRAAHRSAPPVITKPFFHCYERFSVLGDMFRPTRLSSDNKHCVRNYWVENIDTNFSMQITVKMLHTVHMWRWGMTGCFQKVNTKVDYSFEMLWLLYIPNVLLFFG